jgi:NAD(P)-dependent dehydrogenase (short-subunit alcohol dehydrogenase family)
VLLQNKNAVIYGGGGAVGGAVARVFAREGARVFIAGRTRARLGAVAADIATDIPIETAQVDAFDQRAVEMHADAVAARAGGIDIAFNAVSVMHDQGTLLEDLSLDEFLRPIDGFLRTLFITSKAVARHMGGDRPGVILTMSEAGARFAVPGLLGHIVSSAGKETFARVLPRSWRPETSALSVSAHTLSRTLQPRGPIPRSCSHRQLPPPVCLWRSGLRVRPKAPC